MSTTQQDNQKTNTAKTKALIMVIDDNPDFLDSIELTLSMEGYQVWLATDGQKAWEALEAATNQGLTHLPDLILADIMMPVMDGYELHNRVIAHPFMHHIPYIYLTAKDTDKDIEAGERRGPHAYLTKSCTSEHLLAVIEGQLRRTNERINLIRNFYDDSGTEASFSPVVLIVLVGVVFIISIGVGMLAWGAFWG